MTDINYTPASVPAGNQTFSMSRFSGYMRLYMAENFKGILLKSLVLYVITAVIMIIDFHMNYISSYALADHDLERDIMTTSIGAIAVFILIVAMSVAGSSMYASMADAKGRLSVLTTPASQFEKFLTYLCICLPLAFIVSILCLELADATRLLWIEMMSPFGKLAHMIPLSTMLTFGHKGIIESNDALDILMLYVVIFLANSLFALGSIVFHKRSFMKTACTLFALNTVLGWVAFISIHIFFPDGNFAITGDDSITWTTVLTTGIIFFLIITGFYILGYCRFREEEVTARW